MSSSSMAVVCGDGVVSATEACDDQNTLPDDGCSSACAVETGWTCTTVGTRSVCSSICGDGLLLGTEQCDDDNNLPNDGCTEACTFEPGWEREPNNTPATANDFVALNLGGDILGARSSTTDLDHFQFTIPAGTQARVRIETLDGPAGTTCATNDLDSELTLFNSAGTQLNNDDDGGPGFCSLITSATLAAGTYVVELRASDDVSMGFETFDYRLRITLTPVACGDSRTDAPETCDDGNTTAGDGCSNLCATETGFTCTTTAPRSVCTAICGDTLTRGAETCDDGNTTPGDGCNATCVTERCGDGLVNNAVGGTATEQCDDGGTVAGDGCSATCQLETVCGNGVREGAEGCDDGNLTPGDGCAVGCAVEPGYACAGSPRSVCGPVCGDNLRVGTEQCDDGNINGGDCCSATCGIEAGCEVEPNNTAAEALTSSQGTLAGPAVFKAGFTLGDVDFVAFTVPTLVDLRLETFQGSGTTCASIDTVLELRSADGSTILATSDDEGLGSCSLITRTGVAPGTYYARIIDYQQNDAVPLYNLAITFTALCGNGTRESTEVCDDGNRVDTDFCSNLCTRNPGCGDNIVDPTEQCDDGGTVAGDGCSATCQLETVCGNSIREGAEGCDDGNTTAGDGCATNCAVEPGYACTGAPLSTCGPVCGDNLRVGSEQCDDGNINGGDCCSATCGIEAGCEVEPNNTAAQALTSPQGTLTGPAVFKAGFISGDVDFVAFTVATPVDLRLETFQGGGTTCPDIDTVLELRASNGTTILATSDDEGLGSCSLITRTGVAPGTYYARIIDYQQDEAVPLYNLAITFTAVCGNGTRESTEVCDDGNRVDTDFCSNLCTRNPGCGDNIVDPTEQCDDGGTVAGDGCSATCQLESVCGNGTREGIEGCDDNNSVPGDGCAANCAIEPGYSCTGTTPSVCSPVCGDGIRVASEQCDDGGITSGDGCSATCQLEITCGAGETPVVVTAAAPVTITDRASSTAGESSTLIRVPVALAGVVRNVVVALDISTTANAHLDIFLGSPFGATRTVANDQLGANYRTTVLDDSATTNINAVAAVAPYRGRFSPRESFGGTNNLVGQAAQGEWYLRINDDTAGTTATLNVFTLGLCVDTTSVSRCGNGVVEPNEQCDDTNVTAGDGCSATCQLEATCGGGQTPLYLTSDSTLRFIRDGVPLPINGTNSTISVASTSTVRRVGVVLNNVGHQYVGDVELRLTSPGNITRVLVDNAGGSGDHFLSTILLDSAATNVGSGAAPFRNQFKPFQSLSATIGTDFAGVNAAGNWTLNAVDTSNVDSGTLNRWALFLCVDSASAVCGNGTVEPGETCDDGGTANGNGCSSTCQVEPGYACSGAPSVCSPVCGNGIITAPETCDDSDADSNDGCSSTCTVELGYVCINEPSVCDALPQANDDTASVNEDGTADFSVLVNDLFLFNAPLTVTVTTAPVNGTAVPQANNTIRYTPLANFSGMDVFTYQVQDADGDTDTALVMVTVNAINDAPTANAQGPISVAENGSVVITLTGADLDLGSGTLTFAVGTGPTRGALGAITSATPTSATVTYTPTTNLDGPDSFTFTVNDGTDTSAAANVSLSITNVPRCGDGTLDMAEECDDGNTTSGDGCQANCAFTCFAGAGAERVAVNAASGQCYGAFDGTMLTFADARALCETAGGYLTTITSASEQTTVQSLVGAGQNPWIGGTDDGNDTDAVFSWITGETFAYANFAAGQPDDDTSTGGNGEALHILGVSGLWNDTNPTFNGFVVGQICEQARCGNGLRELTEACDDGNTVNNDACSNTCTLTVGRLVINNVFGAGSGGSGVGGSAPFNADFVELFNPLAVPVTIGNWSIQYASTAGNSWSVHRLTPGAIVPAGGTYLVQMNTAGMVGAAIAVVQEGPTANGSASINMAGATGKVALLSNTTALSMCGQAMTSCLPNAAIQDYVGYGTASDFEGTGPTGTLSPTTSAVRANNGCTDTNSNNTDFVVTTLTTTSPASQTGAINICP